MYLNSSPVLNIICKASFETVDNKVFQNVILYVL